MGDILKSIEFLGIPTTIAIALVGLFLIFQVIGEIIELFGKTAPELIKIRKYFKRKKEEKIETTQKKIMKGMRFFDTLGESISTNAFEVDEVIDDHYAIARELR